MVGFGINTDQYEDTCNLYFFVANHSSCVSNDDLRIFINKVLTAYQNGVFNTNETSRATQWDYSSSLFFAMTVTTTIGKPKVSYVQPYPPT